MFLIFQDKYFALLNEKTITKTNDIRSTRESKKDIISMLISSTNPTVTVGKNEKNFNEQIAISDKLYAISIKFNNNSNAPIKSIGHDEENSSIKFHRTGEANNENGSIAMQSKVSSMMENNNKSDQIEQKLMKYPQGVVPFVPPDQQSSENGNQRGNQKSLDTLKKLQKENGEDMGAREENDNSNYFVAEERNQENNYKSKKVNGKKDLPIVNDDDLQVIQQASDVLEDNRNKLKSEVNEDQGKTL